MNRTKTSLLLAVGLTVALPAAGLAAEHPAKLLLLTKLIDQVPTKAQLVEAGAGAHGEALFAIAKDAELSRYPRARAASMLGHFDTDKGRDQLAALLDDPQVLDREVRIQALASLVALEKARAFDRLQGLLSDADPELRAAAVRNLGRIEHPQAKATLQAHLAQDREPVRWVRELTQRTLQRR